MTFDPGKICDILRVTTQQYRKGEMETTKQVGGITVTDIYMMPHVADADPNLVMVDVWFINVGVDKAEAEKHRDELVALLNEWPTEQPLTSGLSYITIGGELGSQDYALCLIALGSVLGFWKVITPALLGADKAKGDELAGSGFIMAGGYKPEKAHA